MFVPGQNQLLANLSLLLFLRIFRSFVFMILKRTFEECVSLFSYQRSFCFAVCLKQLWYNIKAVADKKNDRNLDNWTVKHMKTKILLHSFNFKRTVQWTKTVKGIDSQVVILNLDKHYIREFDPGSGWTLAACLTHASRAKRLRQNLRGKM